MSDTAQQFWDTQFKFSQFLPDFQVWMDRLAQESACLDMSGFSRLPYGDDPRQWVEVGAGTGSPNILPVVIHGGYWRALRAEDHRVLLTGLRGLGAYVANLEYRLLPSVRMADVVNDVCAGLAQISLAHPGQKLLLVGHSAGAHLAAQAMRNPALARHLAGVVAISGLYDLAPIAQSFLQAELALDPCEIAQFSGFETDPACPILYVNGSDETHEFLRQSALAAQAQAAPWLRVRNAHHMSVLEALFTPDTPLGFSLQGWLKNSKCVPIVES